MISVVIPTYNRSATLLRSVASVIYQDYQGEIDVIVVDDGSSDDSIKKLTERFDGQIRIFSTEGRKGAPFARNLGVEKAKFEYVAFQDSDDIWFVDKLSRQFAFMKKHNFDMSFSSFLYGRNGSYTKNPVKNNFHYNGVLDNSNAINSALISNVCSTQTIMINKKSSRLLFDTDFKRFQDWDFFLNAISKGLNIGYIPDPLAYVETGSDSITTNKANGVASRKMIKEKYFSAPSINYITKIRFNFDLLVRKIYLVINP